MRIVVGWVASAALIAVPFSARAQQAPVPDEAGTIAAIAPQTVVVTASRSPQQADQTGLSVSVLSRSAMDADQQPSLVDQLARLPGIAIDQAGGAGQTASVFIRGADSRQTLVLIDGVRVNDVSDPGAGYDFSSLLTGPAARVEVLRGPQSTLYGSDAIGGVVNVVTAAPTRAFEGSAQAEGGSLGTADERVDVGGAYGAGTWQVDAGYLSTDGISAFDRADGGEEKDGTHDGNLGGRVTYEVAPDVTLDERVYYVRSRTAFDGYDTPGFVFGDDSEYNHSSQVTEYAGLNFSLFGGRLRNRVAYTLNDTSRQDYDPDQAVTTLTFNTHGRVDRGEYEGSLAVGDGVTAIFGAETERDRITAAAPSSYDPEPPALAASITTSAGYAQLQAVPVAGLTLAAGGRVTAHSSFGTHVTGQASAAYALAGGQTVLRASIGQGYKAPSLYELYSDYGNAALRPEQAVGWDAGIEQHLFGSAVTARLAWFGRTSRNLIDYVVCEDAVGLCASRPYGYYANVGRARTEGLEAEAVWRVTRAVSLSGNATYMDAESVAAAGNSQLPLRPRLAANAQLAWDLPWGISSSAALRYAGETTQYAGSGVRLPAYALLDLRASMKLGAHATLFGRVQNVTGRRYEVIEQYGTPGRAAYGGVRVDF